MSSVTVNLRIVDATKDKTLYEETVSSVKAGKVKAASDSVSHDCDGTNGNENPIPGPACTNALHKAPTNWDGTYYPNFEDYLIKKILNVEAGENTYWSLWLNFEYVKVGGCQAQIKNHDSILWALIPQKFDEQGVPQAIPLKLKGPRTATRAHGTVVITVTIINGSDRSVVGYARVKAVNGSHNVSVIANGYGSADLTLTTAGTYTVTATKGADIPSNKLLVVVT